MKIKDMNRFRPPSALPSVKITKYKSKNRLKYFCLEKDVNAQKFIEPYSHPSCSAFVLGGLGEIDQERAGRASGCDERHFSG